METTTDLVYRPTGKTIKHEIVKYIILQGFSSRAAEKLSEKVNEYLNNGWTLYGYPHIYGESIQQTMVLWE